jgi:hypothetical protein
MDVIVKYGADDGKLNMMIWTHRKNSKESMMKTTTARRGREKLYNGH